MTYSYRLRVAEHPTALDYAARNLQSAEHITMIGIDAGDAVLLAFGDDPKMASEVRSWAAASREQPINGAGCLLHWRVDL